MQIDDKTLEQVRDCALTHKGGVKVKMNHKTGFDDIVGVLKNFRVEGDQVKADLSLLKTHERFSTILEMAESMPEEFGLSIAFSGQKEKIDGVKYARCFELYSVDLVDAPAANPSGLFSRLVDTNNLDESMFEKFELLADKLITKLSQPVVSPEQLSAVQTEVTQLRTELEAKGGELSTAKAEFEKVSGELSALKAEFDKAKTDHAAALEAKEKDVEARASAKAIEFAAAQGIKPLKADKSGGDTVTISRAEFNKLPAGEQMKFCKTGGKITN